MACLWKYPVGEFNVGCLGLYFIGAKELQCSKGSTWVVSCLIMEVLRGGTTFDFVAFEVIHVSLKKFIVDKVIPFAFVFLH